jgi:hypothetical protein
MDGMQQEPVYFAVSYNKLPSRISLQCIHKLFYIYNWIAELNPPSGLPLLQKLLKISFMNSKPVILRLSFVIKRDFFGRNSARLLIPLQKTEPLFVNV